jgi:hypothetical protein
MGEEAPKSATKGVERRASDAEREEKCVRDRRSPRPGCHCEGLVSFAIRLLQCQIPDPVGPLVSMSMWRSRDAVAFVFSVRWGERVSCNQWSTLQSCKSFRYKGHHVRRCQFSLSATQNKLRTIPWTAQCPLIMWGL